MENNKKVSKMQIMQPWPLCLVSSKNPGKSAHTKYYPWVPSLVQSSESSMNEDCSSNTTLLTNASPFNSQQALLTQKKKPSITITKNKNYDLAQSESHYYTENLKRESELQQKVYNPENKDIILVDYKFLEPLIMENSVAIEEQDVLMSNHKDGDDIGLKRTDSLSRTPKKKESEDMFRYSSQVFAAFAVSIASLLIGFSSSYTSPALPSMKQLKSFELDSNMESWIGSIMPLSALIGGIMGGPLIEYIGRRNTILSTAIPFMAAWLFIATATNVWLVLMGRALSGFSVGIISLVLPVYLGETLQPEVRGVLGLLPTACGNIGILICFTTGMYLNWSILAFFGACIPIIYFLLGLLIPETPRWYVSKGKTKRARKALEWLRGKSVDVTEELAAVEKTHLESEKESSTSSVGELFKPNHIKPLMISIGLMFFQQFSGINAVIFYSTKIFEESGSSIDKSISSIIIGVVNFVATFMATAVIDRLGRKILLYISSVVMIITLMTLATFLYLKDSHFDVSNFGWLPLACIIIYIIAFSMGFGPIPWLMMGEILPAKIRGGAASITTGFNWFCAFLVTKTFQNIIELMKITGAFWMYGGICVLGLLFVILFVPETSGRSLEEIEKKLRGPVRRMSAVANMRPMPTAC
ncbi:Similar to Tret1: Facilitated trehalose transporter Tret1 (Culex quinquefasciatus) [Cotesia congregata]|uniref:Similar to Tret1: Facilitated trehalose transporter Tret1 (Culex quinquefasciatus) n=1 Tax=Cotesia congregata TaxID=51543 RepID=A0A8J2HHJ1_COTCN|nr:Similar to Tret1: Facilitated trehalose transporter Tret1 (Culex quinquefasciatus) [Cotesia congregata]